MTESKFTANSLVALELYEIYGDVDIVQRIKMQALRQKFSCIKTARSLVHGRGKGKTGFQDNTEI